MKVFVDTIDTVLYIIQGTSEWIDAFPYVIYSVYRVYQNLLEIRLEV